MSLTSASCCCVVCLRGLTRLTRHLIWAFAVGPGGISTLPHRLDTLSMAYLCPRLGLSYLPLCQICLHMCITIFVLLYILCLTLGWWSHEHLPLLCGFLPDACTLYTDIFHGLGYPHTPPRWGKRSVFRNRHMYYTSGRALCGNVGRRVCVFLSYSATVSGAAPRK